MKNISEVASELAHRMEIQRNKWFDACLQLITYMNKGQNQIENPTLKGTTEFIIKSFQIVVTVKLPFPPKIIFIKKDWTPLY